MSDGQKTFFRFFKFSKLFFLIASVGSNKCWKKQSHEIWAQLERPLRRHARYSSRRGLLDLPPCRIGLTLASVCVGVLLKPPLIGIGPFTFKTFPKHRATQFWDSFAGNLTNWQSETTCQYRIWKKNFKKSDFFTFFSNRSNFFAWKWILCENALSELLHVETAKKLKSLEISLIFSIFLIDFQFSLIFFKVIKKIFWKGSNELELMPPFKETWFLGWIWLQSQDR